MRSAPIIPGLLLFLLAGCTRGSALAPSDPAPGRLLEGVTVNALDGAPVGGLAVQVEAARLATTDAAGNFTAEVTDRADHPIIVSGSAIVERRTTVAAPASGRVRLTLLPASFDLRAFDEMFRTANARLQRWTRRPALVVLASVMAYKGPADEYDATSEQMSDAEVSLLVDHLHEGLGLLTGGTYTSFAEIAIERPAAGERASVTRPGAIVVGRYSGIQTFTRTIGYGRWAEEADGSVSAGAMFLAWSYDRDNSRRRLLRIHELGHALGLLHVESRASIMNPSVGSDPTDFDRDAAVIAFQRPPGNVSPDTDPGPSARAAPPWGLRWSSPTACTSIASF